MFDDASPIFQQLADSLSDDVDQGVLVKRRGVGMFVADGALDLIRTARRTAFTARFVVPLLAEARTLGIHPDTLVDLLRKEATP